MSEIESMIAMIFFAYSFKGLVTAVAVIMLKAILSLSAVDTFIHLGCGSGEKERHLLRSGPLYTAARTYTSLLH